VAFHDAGAKHRERLLMSANRFGKTMCGAAELAFHLTGGCRRRAPMAQNIFEDLSRKPVARALRSAAAMT
jgi:hypothetical protein